MNGMTNDLINPFMPTVPTFAVRETDVFRHNGGASGAPLKPLRDDSALRALSSLRVYQIAFLVQRFISAAKRDQQTYCYI